MTQKSNRSPTQYWAFLDQLIVAQVVRKAPAIWNRKAHYCVHKKGHVEWAPFSTARSGINVQIEIRSLDMNKIELLIESNSLPSCVPRAARTGRIQSDMEGHDSGLFKSTNPTFVWMDCGKIHKKTHSVWRQIRTWDLSIKGKVVPMIF